MENLEISPTTNTPHVILDARNGRLIISGRSIPEDPDVFYAKIDTANMGVLKNLKVPKV